MSDVGTMATPEVTKYPRINTHDLPACRRENT